MTKVCTNGHCEKGNEPQLIKNFTRRTGKAGTKKDGTPSYSSHCKRCGVVAHNKRNALKRTAAMALKVVKGEPMGKCRDCGIPISKYAKRCKDCANESKSRTMIDSKFLVRGAIKYEGYRTL